jgi:hypothetical protein
MQDITSIVLKRFQRRSHSWGHEMNFNMIRMSMTMGPSVESRVTALPGSAAEGTMYIDPATKKLCMWIEAFDDEEGPPLPADWYSLTPLLGQTVLVKDEYKYYLYNWMNDWELAIDLGATHMGIEREFSWYAPGLMRPNATLFYYIAGIEFTIEMDAPNSGANLEVGPVGGSLVLNILHQGVGVGTITFTSGSTEGVIDFPAERIVQPAHIENQYVRANALSVTSPADTRQAQGLSVTLRGEIRPID